LTGESFVVTTASLIACISYSRKASPTLEGNRAVSEFLRTQLCRDFGIEYPILLAGMGVKGRATPPALVAAVCEAGGMGFLACAGLEADEVRRRIRAVRAMTDRPFGVNLLLPASMAEAASDRAEMRARL